MTFLFYCQKVKIYSSLKDTYHIIKSKIKTLIIFVSVHLKDNLNIVEFGSYMKHYDAGLIVTSIIVIFVYYR